MEQCPAHDLSGNSLLSGFECVLLFPEAAADREEVVTLRATLKNGETIERQLGRIWLCAGYDPMPTAVTWPGEGPRVAICMATFRPPVGSFDAQVASLQAQTHTNWVCIITTTTPRTSTGTASGWQSRVIRGSCCSRAGSG